MGKVGRAAGVLWRYVQVKAGYRQVHRDVRSLQPDDLEHHIRRGCPAFDGIIVNADASRPLLADEWDPDFLHAIVYEDGAVPELDQVELEQARRFVLYGEGAPPSKPDPGPNVVAWPGSGSMTSLGSSASAVLLRRATSPQSTERFGDDR
jgi:hypothetical protein